MENGCEWMSLDIALMCLPSLRGGEGPEFMPGPQYPLSGPAADTDLLDRTRDPKCVLRDFRPDPLARKGKGD